MFTRFKEGFGNIEQDISFSSVFIGFHNRYTYDDIDIIRSYGGYLRYSYAITNAISVKIPTNMIDIIKMLPNVRYIEKVGIMHSHEYPNIYPNVTCSVPGSDYGIPKIRADIAHNSGYKGTNVKVGIVDSGIDKTHQSLSPNFAEGYDAFTGTNDVSDSCGHGTHVSGIVAATGTVSGGTVGVAPEAKIYMAKALKQQTDCDPDKPGNQSGCCGGEDIVAAGIDWCVSKNVKVINMSLGGPIDNTALREACANAYNSHNVLIIASAGNDNGSSCTSETVGYPALYDSVIAISATTSSDSIASFSSRGSKVELSAPGDSIRSTTVNNGYGCKSGTSMSAPFVTGTAALLFSVNPNLTNVQVRQILQQTSIDKGTPGRDGCYGYGRIDSMNAIQNATGNCPIPICTFGLS